MRVVLIDDHPATRLGLRQLLSVPDIKIVADSGYGEDCFRLVRKEEPDLVVLGLNPAREEGLIDSCRRIKSLPGPPRVIVHSAYNFTDAVSSCLLGCADGYVHKRTDCADLLSAVRRCGGGERVWLSSGKSNGEARAGVGGKVLTAREREVLSLMLLYCPNTEMAQRLNVSLPTVKSHARGILRKLGLKNRWELVR